MIQTGSKIIERKQTILQKWSLILFYEILFWLTKWFLILQNQKKYLKLTIQKLEELTPLAKIVLGAKPKPVEATEDAEEEDEGEIEIPDGAKPGPIDVDYKSKDETIKII